MKTYSVNLSVLFFVWDKSIDKGFRLLSFFYDNQFSVFQIFAKLWSYGLYGSTLLSLSPFIFVHLVVYSLINLFCYSPGFVFLFVETSTTITKTNNKVLYDLSDSRLQVNWLMLVVAHAQSIWWTEGECCCCLTTLFYLLVYTFIFV